LRNLSSSDLADKSIQYCGLARIALPDGQHMPTRPAQGTLLPCITRNVLAELLLPELRISLWGRAVSARYVTMPKASMDEHHRLESREYDIGRAGQITSM
jgi:hypothetical protein